MVSCLWNSKVGLTFSYKTLPIQSSFIDLFNFIYINYDRKTIYVKKIIEIKLYSKNQFMFDKNNMTYRILLC